MTTYLELRNLLQKRDVNSLTEIIGHSVSFPPMVRVMAYTAIHTMNKEQLTSLCDKAIDALGYMERNDWDGLTAFMNANNVPVAFVEIVKNYAKNQPI